MRLDHLLSKENRDFLQEEILKNSSSDSRGKRLSGHAVETLAIALFNFEGAVRHIDRGRKDQPIPEKHGGVAQLGEHLLCKQGVRGSIPLISTMEWAHSSAG